jgi:hypothetical protein
LEVYLWILDLVLNLVNANASRWLELLDRCTALQPLDRQRIFAALEQIDQGVMNADQRVSLWESLRERLNGFGT